MKKGTYSSRCGLQREAAKPVSMSRLIQSAAAKVEEQLTRVSPNSLRASSPIRFNSPISRDGHDKVYVGNSRSSRSYGSSQGFKRPHGDRRACSYSNRIAHSYGLRRVCSYGTRRGYSYGGPKVRSYGQRRIFSYGARQGYSFGDGDRRLRLYGREMQHAVQEGHNGISKRFKRLFRAPYIGLLSSSAGALWVVGHFLNTFARNLNFSNLPRELISKYRRAGSEHKSLAQARGVWESIPAQVRAGGPDALSKFHHGKSWSHIIPKWRKGSSTADNAIWWSLDKNRALGPNPMSLADIADAKAVLRSDAIRAAVTQTANGMVKGAIMSVVVGGALACLECGLDYAEGKITKREMVQRVVRAGVMDGGGAFFTTGIIVGISLALPFHDPNTDSGVVCASGGIFRSHGSEGCQIGQRVVDRFGKAAASSFLLIWGGSQSDSNEGKKPSCDGQWQHHSIWKLYH